jgi:hypothetical protein
VDSLLGVVETSLDVVGVTFCAVEVGFPGFDLKTTS